MSLWTTGSASEGVPSREGGLSSAKEAGRHCHHACSAVEDSRRSEVAEEEDSAKDSGHIDLLQTTTKADCPPVSSQLCYWETDATVHTLTSC